MNINQHLIDEYGKDMKIVYTPLHGTGEMLARRAFAQAGFDSVQVVEAQCVPDPDFSTVKSPNPENQAAFALAEELGRKVGADVLVATDPDADRVGVEVLQKTVATAIFQEIKSVRLWLSISLKRTRLLEHFLPMQHFANPLCLPIL